MKDQTIEILLNTPLLVIMGREEIRSRPVLENILRIGGKALQESAAGILIDVKWVGSDRAIEKELPFKQLFVPYYKIDHVVVGG